MTRLVSAVDSPVEWIPGRSRALWFAGFITTFVASELVAVFLVTTGLAWAGVGVVSPRLTLILDLIGVAAAFGPGLLWGNLVPAPLPRLGVFGGGVVVDYGLRSESFPWDRVAVRGDRLVLSSRRIGFISPYRMTATQASRVAFLRPRAG
ncbi:MAG: hypothetical protein L3K09_04440 [Thermoplasmata archaeon]|nr:hypothetical protein [Thermoplasmata archaeon]